MRRLVFFSLVLALGPGCDCTGLGKTGIGFCGRSDGAEEATVFCPEGENLELSVVVKGEGGFVNVVVENSARATIFERDYQLTIFEQRGAYPIAANGDVLDDGTQSYRIGGARTKGFRGCYQVDWKCVAPQ